GCINLWVFQPQGQNPILPKKEKENGHRDLSVDELKKLSKLFNLTTDQILNYENIVPEEVTLEDKPDFEKLHLINQLDEEDRNTVFKIIDTMLTKKKFKDFFHKNVAVL